MVVMTQQLSEQRYSHSLCLLFLRMIIITDTTIVFITTLTVLSQYSHILPLLLLDAVSPSCLTQAVVQPPNHYIPLAKHLLSFYKAVLFFWALNWSIPRVLLCKGVHSDAIHPLDCNTPQTTLTKHSPNLTLAETAKATLDTLLQDVCWPSYDFAQASVACVEPCLLNPLRSPPWVVSCHSKLELGFRVRGGSVLGETPAVESI